MRHPLHAAGLALVLCLSLEAPGHGEAPATKFLPDPRTGVVDGKSEVVILPVQSGEGGPPEILDPAGLEAHLTPTDHPETELVYPCGSWFQPPPGRYRFWIQGGWRMSPHSMVMIHGDRPAKIGMTGVVPIGEAGRVRLPPQPGTEPELELHLLHAGTYLAKNFPRWEISPRKPVQEVGAGVLMPAGRAVGALWDRKSQRYVALSRPFEVWARDTVEIPLERPQGTASLMVRLRRAALASTADDLGVTLAVRQEGGDRPPDLSVLTADRVYAFWYGLAPGSAELRAESKEAALVPQKLDLAAGKIENVQGDLKPKPALAVELDLPAVLYRDQLTLEAHRWPTGEILARQAVRAAARTQRFEKLPPALLEVVLKTGLGSFSRQVDLTAGRDGYLLLKPELITVRGTVYHGDQKHPAKLTFGTVRNTTLTAQTDEDGLYEVALLDALRSVSIELEGIQAAPYADFFSPPIAASKELDFHLSNAEFSVKVLDASTGRGIPNASVTVRNVYLQEKEKDQDEKAPRGDSPKPKGSEREISQAASADDEGVARLPPLRQGSLEIRATAEGYSRPREPVKAQVADEKTSQAFEVRLAPLGDTVALHLRLPNGEPAAGAEVLLVDSLAAGRDLFAARADAEGQVRAPRQPTGLLWVRHPAAAFLVKGWHPGDDESDVEWTLSLPADRPLLLQVKDAAGKSAMAGAELALWVDGLRLSGRALAWLAGTSPLADANGLWIGRNLPRRPVEVLAWSRTARREAGTGQTEGQAVAVSFPWPDSAEIRAAE